MHCRPTLWNLLKKGVVLVECCIEMQMLDVWKVLSDYVVCKRLNKRWEIIDWRKSRNTWPLRSWGKRYDEPINLEQLKVLAIVKYFEWSEAKPGWSCTHDYCSRLKRDISVVELVTLDPLIACNNAQSSEKNHWLSWTVDKSKTCDVGIASNPPIAIVRQVSLSS